MGVLAGLRVVVTRTAHQAEELAQPLRELGAEVLLLPVISVADPADREPLRRAAARCNSYDWIIFTSANAVSRFAAELSVACTARVATVGRATRAVAVKSGFSVSLTPDDYVAESLVEAFAGEELAGQRILLPGAAVTRDVLPAALSKMGAQVEVVEAYRNVMPDGAGKNAVRIFGERLPDWVTFASPSAVENTVSVAGAERLKRVKIASIGPVTSEAVRKFGLIVTVEAREHSVSGLVGAMAGAL